MSAEGGWELPTLVVTRWSERYYQSERMLAEQMLADLDELAGAVRATGGPRPGRMTRSAAAAHVDDHHGGEAGAGDANHNTASAISAGVPARPTGMLGGDRATPRAWRRG